MNALIVIATLLSQNPLSGLKVPGLSAPSTEDQTGFAQLLSRSNELLQLAQLGKAQGSSTSVKSLATTLLKDETVIQSLVKGVANLRGMDLTKTPQDAETQKKKDAFSATLEKLKGLKGAAFDLLFARTVKDKQDDQLADVRSQRSATQDPQVSQVLERVLPMLQKHGDQAQKLLDAVTNKPAS